MSFFGRSPAGGRRRSDILWLDLGNFRDLIRWRGSCEKWQDHGLGLLRTILHRDGITTELLSTRTVGSLEELRGPMKGFSVLVMNVRSQTFPVARGAARMFKEVNPNGLVLTGGLHASVALEEMEAVPEFGKICVGPGEGIIVPLLRRPSSFARVFEGKGARSMGDWPPIERTLWPVPAGRLLRWRYPWPLEPSCGWGPAPVATVLTSRVCPWRCSFCNESSYIQNMGRRPVEALIDELNILDDRYGVGSVVIHDSMFFQNRGWLEEFLGSYPRKARRPWPYWAAARSDMVRRWPDLFEALIKETNWNTVSIGFESGSDRMLRMLNKECTEEDNDFAIGLVNRIGDEMESRGRDPVKFWANIILAIPGETREEAFRTLRMVRRMKRVMPSMSIFAPYPGSALGYQLIAEGKSIMSKDNYHRFPGNEKVKGVDYGFYRDLLRGRYDRQVRRDAVP